MFIHLKNISQIGSFPQVGGKWSKIVETTQDERQGAVWKNNTNDWCRSRGNKSAIDKLDGFFVFPIAAKESRFFLRHWHFHGGFGHQAHVKPPQSGTIRGKRCVNCCLCVYTNVYVIKFCNWSCFKILDNVKFSDVRGLRAHQRLRFGAVNPLLLRTLVWMKVQCSYAHDSKLIVIFPLGPTNHHRHWHVATLVNLSTSIHPSSKSSPEGVDLRHLGRYAPVLPFGARRPDHRGWSVFLEGNVVFFSPSKKRPSEATMLFRWFLWKIMWGRCLQPCPVILDNMFGIDVLLTRIQRAKWGIPRQIDW